MILKDIETASRYLPSLNWKMDSTRLNDFFDRSQKWVVEKIIGTDIEDLLEAALQEGQEDPHADLRKLTCRVIGEEAYLCAVAEMDLQLSEAGFVVQSNDAVSPASQQRTDRLVASLKARLAADCDALVRYLWRYSKPDAAYEDWRGSFQFRYLTAAFVPRLEVLRQNAVSKNIETWQEFYELIPMMANALKTTVASYCSIEQIETLLELYRDNELLETHRKAIRFIEMAVVASVVGTKEDVIHYSIEARNYMIKHESDFADFAESDIRELPGISFDAGGIVNTL